MPDPESGPHLETTAVNAGRSASGDSLAPVLFPSTTYAVEHVADHAAMVGAVRTTKLYSRFGSPTVRELRGRGRRARGRRGGAGLGVGHGVDHRGDPRAVLDG